MEPFIEEIQPREAMAGEQIVIYGSNLTAMTTARFVAYTDVPLTDHKNNSALATVPGDLKAGRGLVLLLGPNDAESKLWEFTILPR